MEIKTLLLRWAAVFGEAQGNLSDISERLTAIASEYGLDLASAMCLIKQNSVVVASELDAFKQAYTDCFKRLTTEPGSYENPDRVAQAMSSLQLVSCEVGLGSLIVADSPQERSTALQAASLRQQGLFAHAGRGAAVATLDREAARRTFR